jgi:LPXTG-motif cell wall-anchored protein
LRRSMMLAAMLVMLLAAAAAPALAQENVEAKINDEVWSNVDPKTGIATTKAGGTAAKAGCPEGGVTESQSGDIYSKAPCKPEEKAPAPKAAPPPPPPPAKVAPPAPAPPAPGAPQEAPKELPKSGGTGSASLLGLGVGALLVGGGLLARRLIR